MVVIFCYFRKENYEVLKFYVNNSSFFGNKRLLFSKRRTKKLQRLSKRRVCYFREHGSSKYCKVYVNASAKTFC